MDKLSRDCASLVILGICCFVLSIVLMYGLIGQRYYMDIDTIMIVYHLTGWNIISTIIASIVLPPIVFTIGLVLVACAFE